MNNTQAPAQMSAQAEPQRAKFGQCSGDFISAQTDLVELEKRAQIGEYVSPGALWAAREEAALESFERAQVLLSRE